MQQPYETADVNTEGRVLSSEELEQINLLSRRELTAEEVYTFPLILCDNEIDRDGECFTTDALYKLAELFVGKTGIFDHDAKGANQTARIYRAEVTQDTGKRTQSGEAYRAVRAYAYMVRSPHTEGLILEIDAGIKKEVSVGCSVRRVACSVCGANQKERACEHSKGSFYDGQLCFFWLDEPTDAYEWSFVAVPAQKNAGITKRMERVRGFEESDGPAIAKALEGTGGRQVCLNREQARALADYVKTLEGKRDAAADYEAYLRKEAARLMGLTRPDAPDTLLRAAVERLPFTALKELVEEERERVDKSFCLAPQTFVKDRAASAGNGSFMI